MSDDNKNVSAFNKATTSDLHLDNATITNGLTKREYAAIHILSGMCSHTNPCYCTQIATNAADKLFEELEK